MDLLALLQQLNGLIVSLQQQLVDAEQAAQTLADVKFAEGKEAGFAEGKAVGYAEGFEAGKLEGAGSDKIYSQAELDAKLAEALAPIQAELESVKSQFEQFKFEAQAALEAAVVQAKAELKAQLKAAYKAAQEKEALEESGFDALLD